MVSFIIPSYNSHLTIAKTIESIFSQSRKDLIADVIVVDSSDDGKTREVLKTFSHANFKLMLQNQKTPPSAGRNIGARQASGDLLCFIDSDVYLNEDWLKVVLQFHSQGCLAGGGSISLPSSQVNNPLAAAQLYLQFNEYLDTGIFHNRSFVPSCNLFCERKVFERVGGFPNLRASEDTMFCLAVNKLEKIWFVPDAKCFHIFREDWDAFKRNQQLLGKYVMIYRREYYQKWFYKGIFPVLFFPAFLAIKMVWITMRLQKSGKSHINAFLKSIGIFFIGIGYWSIGFLKGCFEKNETA